MGPAKTWTNNQIEPLTGDPLSGLDSIIQLMLQHFSENNTHLLLPGFNCAIFQQCHQTMPSSLYGKSSVTGTVWCLFQALHHSVTYGILWPGWHKFYDSTKAEEVEKMTKNSWGVHYFNFMSKNSKKLLMDPRHPLYKVFQSSCPLTEENLMRPLIGTPYRWNKIAVKRAHYGPELKSTPIVMFGCLCQFPVMSSGLGYPWNLVLAPGAYVPLMCLVKK